MGEVIAGVERLLSAGSDGGKVKWIGVVCAILSACLLLGVTLDKGGSTMNASPDPLVTSPVTGMQFRLIPAGQRWLGSADWEIERMLSREAHPDLRRQIRSEKRRLVTFERPFYMGTTEVTVGQFRKFVEATGYVTQVERVKRSAYGLRDGKWVMDVGYSWRNMGQSMTDDHPACNLTFADAAAFCEWLTLSSGKKARYRLPTESEWEYACRAGQDWTWPFGRTASLLEVYAWCRTNCGAMDNQVRPVATRSASAWGLFDMLGNVQELCVDDSAPAADPWRQALVLKGGNISGSALHLRPAARNPTDANSPEGGFRVVMEPLDGSDRD
jgi:formylglycine-generating enzyme required for sulfatase activity